VQFLFEGAAQGERGLHITLSETAEELRAVAESHGWSLDGIDVFENGAIVQPLGTLAPVASGLR
jgi:circadian clock protein KaiC